MGSPRRVVRGADEPDAGWAESMEQVALRSLPPHSIEEECATLGSVLIAPEMWQKVCHLVGADDFYKGAHRTLWLCMEAVVGRGEPPDALNVFHEVERRKAAEATGGRSYIAELAASVNSPAHAEHYATRTRERALKRRMVNAGVEIARRGYDVSCSPSDGAALMRGEAENIERGLVSVVNGWASEWADPVLTELLHPPKLDGGDRLSFGITEFDRVGCAMAPGDYYVLAGWTGNGKSTLGIGYGLLWAMRTGRPVLYVTLEMPAEQIIRKSILHVANVADPQFNEPPHTDRDRLIEAANEIARTRLLVPDPSKVPRRIDRFTEWLYGVCSQVKPCAVIVDHAGKLESAYKTAYERAAEISSKLRLWCLGPLKVPMLALYQLNREGKKENRPPDLHDLRDAGTIEEDAVAVLMSYRPWACTTKREVRDRIDPHLSWLYIRKLRGGENHRAQKMRFDGARSRILPEAMHEGDSAP